MDIQKIGGLIARTRKEQGLTQRELAERLHISDRAVSKWERGLNLPEVSLFEPLCQALGITVAELLRGERETATIPALEQAVGEAVTLAGAQEQKKKLYRRAALVLLALLSAAGVLIGRPAWEERQRQKLYDRDEHWPKVAFSYQTSVPSVTYKVDGTLMSAYGPFESNGSLFHADPLISRSVSYPPYLFELELDTVPGHIRFCVEGAKREMEMKVLRWPERMKGTDAGFEEGEPVAVCPWNLGGHGHEYMIEGLEPGYLYSVVFFWGDGYYAEYSFLTGERAGY